MSKTTGTIGILAVVVMVVAGVLAGNALLWLQLQGAPAAAKSAMPEVATGPDAAATPETAQEPAPTAAGPAPTAAAPPGWIFPAGLGLSVIILLGVAFLAWRSWQAQNAFALAPVFSAGDWIMQQALGKKSILPTAPGTLRKARGTKDPVIHDLETWYSELRKKMDEEVAARTYEMQQDLHLATDFQRAMLERAYPKVPDVHVAGKLRLGFAHRYEPASGLGGDFFDILKLGMDAGAVFIADVMGHGTRSALITSILRTLIGDLIGQGRNASLFVSEINNQFCQLLKNVPAPLFASALYFVADTTSRMATYASAGHPPPFVLKRGLNRVARLEVGEPRAAALGVIPNETFPGMFVRIADGDVFVFFTDGVFEAFNRDGEEYGIERLEKYLQRNMFRELPVLVNGIYDNVLEFANGEPMADDVCIIACEVTSKPEEKKKTKAPVDLNRVIPPLPPPIGPEPKVPPDAPA